MGTRLLTNEEEAAWAREVVPAAFSAVIQPCSTAFSVIQDDELKPAGSGVFLQIADSYFIVSAAHVLDFAAIHELRLLIPRSSEPAEPIELNGVGYLLSQPTNPRNRSDRTYDPYDIGVCKLTEEIVDQLKGNFRFLHLTSVDSSGAFPSGVYAVEGYPEALVERENQRRRVMNRPMIYHTNIREPAPESEAPLRSNSIFFSYSQDRLDQNYNSVSIPPLKGISGGGIWRLANPRRTREQWDVEDVRLVGIGHTYRKQGGYIRGTAISAALILIKGKWPDLGPAIDLVHPRIQFELG